MALYGSAAGVLAILDSETAMDAATVAPFLTAANRIVTDRLTGHGIATATLEQIENWLAAHLIAMSDREPGLDEEQIGEARNKRSGKTATGLDATRYGQMAKALDPTGRLGQIGKRRAFFDVLDHISGGTP